VLEEGIFFKGTKHGRWVRKDKDNILLDKEKYYKGWPRESMVSYYDRERKKIKEIIPIEYGEKEGNYFYFHENGQVAVAGEFHWDAPVNEWVEYYPNGFRKKIIRYDEDPFDQIFRPFTLKEWDPRGKVVYEVKP
jgi:antitoxin component YwqK of YwqJK toxin-antitoxin module